MANSSSLASQKTTHMKKNVLVFGLISGLVVSTIMSISMLTINNNPEIELGNTSMIVGYLSMLVAFSLIYVAVKNFRDKQNNGVISFGKAFGMGLLIALIGSTIYVIVWAFIYNVYMPDFMDKYWAQMQKAAQASGSAAEIQETTAEMVKYKELYKNPFFFTLITYAEIVPVGLLVSLITALILKRKNKPKVEVV